MPKTPKNLNKNPTSTKKRKNQLKFANTIFKIPQKCMGE